MKKNQVRFLKSFLCVTLTTSHSLVPLLQKLKSAGHATAWTQDARNHFRFYPTVESEDGKPGADRWFPATFTLRQSQVLIRTSDLGSAVSSCFDRCHAWTVSMAAYIVKATLPPPSPPTPRPPPSPSSPPPTTKALNCTSSDRSSSRALVLGLQPERRSGLMTVTLIATAACDFISDGLSGRSRPVFPALRPPSVTRALVLARESS